MSSLRHLRQFQVDCISLLAPIPCPVAPSSDPTIPLPEPGPEPISILINYGDGQNFFAAAGTGILGDTSVGQQCTSLVVGDATDFVSSLCAEAEGVWYYY